MSAAEDVGGMQAALHQAPLGCTGQGDVVLPRHGPAARETTGEMPQPGEWTARSLNRTQLRVTSSRLEVGSWGAVATFLRRAHTGKVSKGR